MKKRYKVISEEFMKTLISFLDEVQFDAAGNTDKDSMHKVNFCNWAINELLNSYDAFVKNEHKKKSRDDYVEETFMDWNLPEMSDEEYEKLVDQFDNFLRNWEKEYNKKNPKKKAKRKPKKPTFTPPPLEDVSEYMSLEEIKEYLLDDPELTPEERFDLYYEEHCRVQDKYDNKKANKDINKMLKNLGIEPHKPNKKN